MHIYCLLSSLNQWRALAQFCPSRGIRQGDPLSPYLFTLCAKDFSACISQLVSQGNWCGIHMGLNAPNSSHLFFVDDCLLFMQDSPLCTQTLLSMVGNYEKVSGQRIILNKSTIFFAKRICVDRRQVVAQQLGMRIYDGKDKFLGLPFLIGRSKTEIFAYLKEHMWKKTHWWKENLLSRGGKYILIKVVLQAIPCFATLVFKLPKSLCDELHSLIGKFWWSSTKEGNGQALVSWDMMCRPKMQGGLGFRDFPTLNQSLLAKQGWRLLHFSNSLLSKVLKTKYYLNKDFVHATTRGQPSYLWRSILHGRDLLIKSI